MNAVEIEEAVSKLAEMPYDAESFPYAFLEAFGNKATTIQKLRSGASNKSDVSGGVLQRNHIHIAVAESGKVGEMMNQLRASKATSVQKAKFILSTDGVDFQAEDLTSDDPPVVCTYKDFPNHFGFFLALAGISTVKQIRESSFDIKATGRLNRLYLELLKDNPKWGTAERRHDMNHFMARLIFCFFAEDTGIFNRKGLFSSTVEQMSERDSSNTNEVISEIFRAMNTAFDERGEANLPRWVSEFPYVNGGLFSGKTEVPRFSKIARSYLLHIGNLEWNKINPDIFGSMIQAVTEDEERGSLGMHYTSVPNILRVLNPLFLDDLRLQLEKAGDNSRMLLNLRKRMSKIRVFDPACGSGNFLVIAYKEMRAIEAEINNRRGEPDLCTEITLTNFRGIELRDFPAEIARLALIVAEYQCDVLYRGQMQALLEFLPLAAENWIICGNSLRIDWTKACPAPEPNDGELFICGNPPYKGAREQTAEQKKDLEYVFGDKVKDWKILDYVCGWFMKGIEYGAASNVSLAFVATNSICQGQHVPALWPYLLKHGHVISFAHTGFKWTNLASNNAAVIVVVVGLSKQVVGDRRLFSLNESGETILKVASNINAYLISGSDIIIEKLSKPLSELSEMNYGNYPGDGNFLSLTINERLDLIECNPEVEKLIRPVVGAQEFIKSLSRFCLWINDDQRELAESVPQIAERISSVKKLRLSSKDKSLNKLANRPHQYRDRNVAIKHLILAPTVSSERRNYLPVGFKDANTVTTNQAFALHDAEIWHLAVLSSTLHLTWVTAVCGKMKSDIRYSNTLGWNTFPISKLTEQNKIELALCAQDILLARESHFPATLAELYDPNQMPQNLRQAHARNDEVLERIYIGRLFKNDTERLEKLFELYAKMVIAQKSKTQLKVEVKKKKAKS